MHSAHNYYGYDYYGSQPILEFKTNNLRVLRKEQIIVDNLHVSSVYAKTSKIFDLTTCNTISFLFFFFSFFFKSRPHRRKLKNSACMVKIVNLETVVLPMIVGLKLTRYSPEPHNACTHCCLAESHLCLQSRLPTTTG